MAKKVLLLPLLIVLACAIAGVYGMLHFQLTYTISPAYYAGYTFNQFSLTDEGHAATISNQRIAVSVIGLLGTWWIGIPVGLILGLVGLIHNSSPHTFRITLKAFAITIMISLLTGFIGLAYAPFTS